MSLKQKVTQLVACYGAPTKFAVETILSAVLPGSPAVVNLVLKFIDCARETSKDIIDYDPGQEPATTPADLERVEQMLELLTDDLHRLVAQVAALADLPEAARRLLDVALRTDEHCRKALDRLAALARRFDRLEEQNRRLLEGQGYMAGMLEDLLPTMNRLAGMMDFVEDLIALGVSPQSFQSGLHRYRLAAQAVSRGQAAEAVGTLRTLCDEQPRSSAAFVGVAASYAAGMDPVSAQGSLKVAMDLRPDDPELLELDRRITRAVTRLTRVQASDPPAPGTSTGLPKVGDSLDGWQLDALLGQGGMGLVFRATRNGQVAALKILNAQLSGHPDFIDRFKREIKALIRLGGHPNIVDIGTFGYAPDRGCWYAVLKWVDGLSLEHHLARHGGLTPDRARGLFLALADGLAAAHRQGIVHRDVKPDNILLPDEGPPVLVDFGLATIQGDLAVTRPNFTPGHTAAFAAPEQIRKGQADTRSDVYSLAASLYYALAYADRRRREPDLYDADLVPPELQPLLTKAMHRDPEHRYRDAAEFREALDAACRPRLLEIKIPGTWSSRPADEASSEWVKITQTPATVEILSNYKYSFRLENSADTESRQLSGLAIFSAVPEFQELTLSDNQAVTDAGLACLRSLTRLHTLTLHNCGQVTDAGLAHLPSLARLHTLNLTWSGKVTDAGLAHLRGLTRLHTLNLSGCKQVTDAGLAHLRSLTQLHTLYLTLCKQLTDAGLEHLQSLTQLRTLILSDCRQVTDAGLAHLRGLIQLDTLYLSFCKPVTDAGLAHLRSLTQLHTLDLSGCEQVTDAGLAHLRSLTQLHTLSLYNCEQVTDAGLAHLRGLTRLRKLDLSGCKQVTDAERAYWERSR